MRTPMRIGLLLWMVLAMLAARTKGARPATADPNDTGGVVSPDQSTYAKPDSGWGKRGGF